MEERYCECGCKEIVKEMNRFIQGHNSRVRSKEIIEKIRNSVKGFKHTEESKKKMREIAKNNPTFLSEESKQKIRISKLGDKNPAKRYDVRKKISMYRLGILKEEDWKGFERSRLYDNKFLDNFFRNQIKKRDDNECQICGIKLKRSIIHHIDADKRNTNHLNCILVCSSCHNKIHSKEFNFWKQKLKELQEIRLYGGKSIYDFEVEL